MGLRGAPLGPRPVCPRVTENLNLSTCTDLIDAINAVVEPPNFTDIYSSCAALTLASAESLVQLSAGGTAILSAPSSMIDGRPFTVKVAGKIPAATGSDPNIAFAVYLGSTISGPNNIASNGYGTAGSDGPSHFYVEISGLWDSLSEYLSLNASGFFVGETGDYEGMGGQKSVPSIASYSDVTFVVSGQAQNCTSSPTITLTQFSIEFD